MCEPSSIISPNICGTTGTGLIRVKPRQERTDQDILPKQPLTVGPGYQSNPESEYVNPQEAQEEN